MSDEADDLTGVLEGHTEGVPEQNDFDAARVSKFMQEFNDAASIRQPWDTQWELNHNVLRGNQLIMRNRVSGEIQYLVRDDRKRLVAVNNVLRPTARALVGKLTKNIPTWSVVPATDDLKDLQASECVEALLEFQRRRLRFDRLYITKTKHIVKHGIAITKLFWDPQEGPITPMCKTCGYIAQADPGQPVPKAGDPCPKCQLELQQTHAQQTAAFESTTAALPPDMTLQAPAPLDLSQVPALEDTPEGDVGLSVIPPYEFFVDPGATTLEETQWVCHRVALPVPRLRKMFPEKAETIVEDGLTQNDRSNGVTVASYNALTNTRLLKDHAYLYEFHEIPTDKHPKGRVIWICNSKILKEVDSPYWPLLKRFPFYVDYWEKEDGEFYGESWIEQAWHIQRELNILRTQKREFRELTLRPRLLMPMGSGVAIDEVSSQAGQVIYFNAMAGAPPKFQEVAQMPAYIIQEEDGLTQSIRAQATISTHEAGIAPSDNSGRFAAILEAQSDQQVGPILKYNAVEYTSLGHGMAILCCANYRDDRVFTVLGDERPKTYAFKQVKVGAYSDIIVYEDDALSHNPALRVDQVTKLANEIPGIFNDPKTGMFDVKAFAKKAKLKLGSVGSALMGSDRIAAAALPSQIEEALSKGQGYQWTPQEARPWDDAQAWSEELLAWLKSSGRSAAQEIVAQVVAAWQFYTAEYQKAVMAQAAQAAQAQGGAKPGASAGPKSGGPMQQGGQTGGASDKTTSAAPEAAAITAGADRAGEAAAAPGGHE